MNFKKAFIVIFVIITILAAVIFGARSCEPRKKTLNPEDIYGAFINANIEFTCEIIKNPSLANKDNEEKAKEQVNEIYKKYKLPVDNDAEMLTILERYQDDPEVIGIIKNNTKLCLEGGEGLEYQSP